MDKSNVLLPYFEALKTEDVERIKALSRDKTTLDELWIEFGESIVGSAASGEPPLISAKKAFNRILIKLKQSLCKDSKIQSYINDDKISDVLSLAMIFTAKLASDHFDGFDICAAGLLVAKIGLRNLCEADYIE